MKKMKLFTALCFTLAFANANAQADSNQETHTIGITIPAVALVDVEGGTNIDLTFAAPTEAGLPIAAPADNTDLWLNYSFIPSASGETARVDVKIDALVTGLDINVTAGADAGNGDGTKGTAAGTLTLTNTDQNIITAIGASYTGTGTSNGHNLTYSLDVNGGTSDYSNLFANVNTVTVTYTIVEN